MKETKKISYIWRQNLILVLNRKKIPFPNRVLFLLILLLCSLLIKSCKQKQITDLKIPIIELNTLDTLVDADFQWNELKKVFQEHYIEKYPKQMVEINAILDELTLIEVPYYGFDYQIHKGQLICNQMVESELISIFNELFELKFPINSVKPISEFQFEDTLSMQANNSTCFDYRLKVMKNGLSKHAHGLALDINPMQNPYFHRTKTEPKNHQSELSIGRIRTHEEMSKKVIIIFKKYGWKWGGSWKSAKDYMHFEK